MIQVDKDGTAIVVTLETTLTEVWNEAVKTQLEKALVVDKDYEFANFLRGMLI